MFNIPERQMACFVTFLFASFLLPGCQDSSDVAVFETGSQKPKPTVATSNTADSIKNVAEGSGENATSNEDTGNALQPKQVLSLQEVEEMSLADVRSFAAKGDPAAQLELAGRMIAEVQDRTSKEEMAPIVRLMKQASDQGYEAAVLGLANFYFVGLGVEADRERAESLMREAMAGGSGKPEANLGLIRAGEGKYAEAAELFIDGANKGDATAQSQLAQMLLGKQLSQEAFGRAEQHFLNAAAQGSKDAMFVLAELNMTSGASGASESKAVAWYQNAAAKGHVVASYNLGVIAAQNQELELASGHFRTAAEAGNVDAMMNLGVVLFQLRDYAASEKWLSTAVDNGSVEAIQRLHTVRRQRRLVGQ